MGDVISVAPTILLTGARGFVGTHARAAIAKRWRHATVVSLVTPEESGTDFVAADILDRAAVERAVAAARPDIIVHLAGQASVARTSNDNGATYAVNLGGSLHLALALARHAPNATLLFASSSEVYGESFINGRVTEESPTHPLNDYAKSKYLAEQVFAAVLPKTARLIIARPFNHTGAGQREDFVLPSFAGQVARIEAGLQAPQMRVGRLDVRRDFLDVRDVVDAYLSLLEAAPNLPSPFVCNVATGQSRPLLEHLETLRAMSRVPFDIVTDPARLRPVDVPIAEGDATRLRDATGWTPKINPRQMLFDLLEAARRTCGAHAPTRSDRATLQSGA